MRQAGNPLETTEEQTDVPTLADLQNFATSSGTAKKRSTRNSILSFLYVSASGEAPKDEQSQLYPSIEPLDQCPGSIFYVYIIARIRASP